MANNGCNLVYLKATADQPYSNFGDALSPIIVSLLSGRPINHCNLDSEEERISAIGTIAHSLRNGRIHVWGSGLDAAVPQDHAHRSWSGPRTPTEFVIHATRGPLTRVAFEAAGWAMSAPSVYGDPAILLPRYFQGLVEQRRETSQTDDKIGIVLHLSELELRHPLARAKPSLLRYQDLDSSLFSIINPLVEPSPVAVIEKVIEISTYDYILSTSLHGLIIADCFGVKSAWLSPGDGVPGFYGNLDLSEKIDHRFRDYHLGLGLLHTPVFPCPLHGTLDYSSVKSFLDSLPPKRDRLYNCARNLVGSFPGPVAPGCQYQKLPLMVSGIQL